MTIKMNLQLCSSSFENVSGIVCFERKLKMGINLNVILKL